MCVINVEKLEEKLIYKEDGGIQFSTYFFFVEIIIFPCLNLLNMRNVTFFRSQISNP